MLYVIGFHYFEYAYGTIIIDVTRLLHMLYVVLLVLHGISSRAFTAIWYCTLCDRYAIIVFLPAFLSLYMMETFGHITV